VSDALLGVLIGRGIGFAGSYVIARVSNRGENERLDRQLMHERALREREELRTLIDDAIQTVQDGIYAALEMRTALATKPENRDDAVKESYGRARSTVRQIERRLNGYQSRLAIRLKVGNPLAEAVKECRVQLGVFRMFTATELPDREIEKPTLTELEKVTNKASDLAERFEEKAVAYAGFRARNGGGSQSQSRRVSGRLPETTALAWARLNPSFTHARAPQQLRP
jgi:hypothetical protein